MSVAVAVLISAEILAIVLLCYQSKKIRWMRLSSRFAKIEAQRVSSLLTKHYFASVSITKEYTRHWHSGWLDIYTS